MNSGLQQGHVNGILSGPLSGLGSGLQSSVSMKMRLNSLNPSTITEPKLKPVFYINADNVALTSGSVQIAYNLIENTSNQLFPKVENIFDQTAGTTYRPPLVVNGLNGRNYMNFADTGNRYLSSSTAIGTYMYASTTPAVSATGMTYMFVIKRKLGGTYTIFDGRDSSTLATTGDLLLEVTANGAITFTYCGGNSGTVSTMTGTAGINLLNEWSILTVKCQLRTDNGNIPSDTDTPGGSPKTTRFLRPIDNRFGNISSAIDIFVDGVEQPKTIGGGSTFLQADWYNDLSYRMLDRDIWIGNKGSVFATSGTHIASALMIPSYISNAYQQRLENYFRLYYSLPF
jgi:hypothetical protein